MFDSLSIKVNSTANVYLPRQTRFPVVDVIKLFLEEI